MLLDDAVWPKERIISPPSVFRMRELITASACDDGLESVCSLGNP